MINQVYPTNKEGLHPGKARNEENQLKWAVPYKLENWNLVSLNKDMHDIFEGEEGYKKGGKEVKDATIDVMFRTPIENPLVEFVVETVGTNILNGNILNKLKEKISNFNQRNNNDGNINK
ncbi:MAG: hypothetical protein AB1304_03225 [Bacteroidota bacterium]